AEPAKNPSPAEQKQSSLVPNNIIQFPISDPTQSKSGFTCPVVGNYNDLKIYPSFFSQLGTFFPILEKVTQSEKTKTKQYYYPLPVDDSMYFIEFELDEKKNTDGDIIIDVDKKKETKKSKDDQICDGIENVTKDLNTDKIVFYELENGKIGQQDGRGVPNFVPTEDTTEPPTIANDDERITTDTNHAKKVTGRKYMKIDGYVLINILETGFLNYIIYSHRSTSS
ncbi:12146_t:CDS:2, partial [Entrophospora sp. SA101]